MAPTSAVYVAEGRRWEGPGKGQTTPSLWLQWSAEILLTPAPCTRSQEGIFNEGWLLPLGQWPIKQKLGTASDFSGCTD